MKEVFSNDQKPYAMTFFLFVISTNALAGSLLPIKEMEEAFWPVLLLELFVNEFIILVEILYPLWKSALHLETQLKFTCIK